MFETIQFRGIQTAVNREAAARDEAPPSIGQGGPTPHFIFYHKRVER